MRVLYVLPSLLTGGAEALVSQWAALLPAAGHTVEVCTLYTGGPFARRLAEGGIRVHNLNHDPGIERYRLRRKYDPALVAALARLIRSGGYPIVHGHLFPVLLHLAFVSVLVPGPAYLYTEHSVQNRRRRHPAFKPLDRLLYSRYRQILPASEGVAAALCRWLPELRAKVQVVPNTVAAAPAALTAAERTALRDELGIAPGEAVVLYAGRLVPEKGADVLLAALTGLTPPGPVRVLVAGDGPLRAELEERARALTGPVQASLLGNREDLPRLLALADLVVLPSRWEGLPMFLLEAMAAGKAVLACAVGGIPDAVEHGASGWLVAPEDPPALGAALSHLLTRPPLRARLGAGARQTFAARFSPEQAVETLLAVYARYDPAAAGWPDSARVPL